MNKTYNRILDLVVNERLEEGKKLDAIKKVGGDAIKKVGGAVKKFLTPDSINPRQDGVGLMGAPKATGGGLRGAIRRFDTMQQRMLNRRNANNKEV